MAVLQLFPEILEESSDATIVCKLLPFELRRVVILWWFAMLESVNSLVDLLDASSENRRAQERVNQFPLGTDQLR